MGLINYFNKLSQSTSGQQPQQINQGRGMMFAQRPVVESASQGTQKSNRCEKGRFAVPGSSLKDVFPGSFIKKPSNLFKRAQVRTADYLSHHGLLKSGVKLGVLGLGGYGAYALTAHTIIPAVAAAGGLGALMSNPVTIGIAVGIGVALLAYIGIKAYMRMRKNAKALVEEVKDQQAAMQKDYVNAMSGQDVSDIEPSEPLSPVFSHQGAMNANAAHNATVPPMFSSHPPSDADGDTDDVVLVATGNENKGKVSGEVNSFVNEPGW